MNWDFFARFGSVSCAVARDTIFTAPIVINL